VDRGQNAGEIFFQDFVDGRADAVFVRARLGFHGKGNRRLRNARRWIINRRVLVASVLPVTVSFSLATAPMSPA